MRIQPEGMTSIVPSRGVKRGITYGETDEFGFDHTKLTYLDQGRRFRLTDVFGEVVPGLIT